MAIIEIIAGILKAIPIADKWFTKLIIWWAASKDKGVDDDFDKIFNKIFIHARNLRKVDNLQERRQEFRNIIRADYDK